MNYNRVLDIEDLSESDIVNLNRILEILKDRQTVCDEMIADICAGCNQYYIDDLKALLCKCKSASPHVDTRVIKRNENSIKHLQSGFFAKRRKEIIERENDASLSREINRLTAINLKFQNKIRFWKMLSIILGIISSVLAIAHFFR